MRTHSSSMVKVELESVAVPPSVNVHNVDISWLPTTPRPSLPKWPEAPVQQPWGSTGLTGNALLGTLGLTEHICPLPQLLGSGNPLSPCMKGSLDRLSRNIEKFMLVG